jgi:uncharacterized protein YfdQ (DUF2303 family)
MSEAQTIADLAVKANGGAEILKTEAGREYLVLPNGSHQDVTEPNAIPATLPDHIKQSVVLQTVDSLVDYGNRFKTENTVLFADIAANTIVASIDYHAPAAAGHLGHKATLTLPFSVEWKTWSDIDGKLMEQIEFARFLEENAGDVVAPTGAELLDACRDLQARRKVNFTKAVRTSSDNESFEYTDETTATTKKGDVEIPSKFQLQIPVYFGGAVTDLFAFLRWRLVEGEGLKLGVRLHRAEHVRQAVFKQIVTDAAERTGCPSVFGRLS